MKHIKMGKMSLSLNIKLLFQKNLAQFFINEYLNFQ